MAKILAYDIDGTLTREVSFDYSDPLSLYRARTVNERAADQVRTAYRRGWTVLLWTGRGEDKRRVTEDWLRENRIPYHLLLMGKLPYTYLVCDRARSVEEFEEVLSRKNPDEPAAELHRIARGEWCRMFPDQTAPTWLEMPPGYRRERRRLIAILLKEPPGSAPMQRLLNQIQEHVLGNPCAYTVPWDKWPQLLSLALNEVWKRYGPTQSATPPEPA